MPSSTTTNTSSETTKDLTHLTTFLHTLHPLTPSSTAIANLHRLCHVLYSIARLYIEARSASERGDHGQSHGQNQSLDQGQGQGQSLGLGQIPETVGVEFDACFSALGLAPFAHHHPPATSASDSGQGPGGGGDWNADQTTRLENWFSGNQYMMGLLEEDLSLIDCSGW